MRWQRQQQGAHIRFTDRATFWGCLRTLSHARGVYDTQGPHQYQSTVLAMRQLNSGADADVLAAFLQYALEDNGMRNELYDVGEI